MYKNVWDHVTPQTIANFFRKAGFLSENSENIGDEETKQTVTINSWDDVRQSVNNLFDYYINMNLEVGGYLLDSDILSSLRCSQSSDEEGEQKCIEPPPTNTQILMH